MIYVISFSSKIRGRSSRAYAIRPIALVIVTETYRLLPEFAQQKVGQPLGFCGSNPTVSLKYQVISLHFFHFLTHRLFLEWRSFYFKITESTFCFCMKTILIGEYWGTFCTMCL